MKTIYMHSTLVYLASQNVDIDPLIKSGTIERTECGLTYLLIIE